MLKYSFLSIWDPFYMKQEFRFPIENHFRDQGLQSLFPQSECSPNSLSDSREDAENEAERKTLDAEMQRGGKEAFAPRVLTILQKLSPFGKWEEWIWGLDKDILSDTKILWVGNLNHHDSQQKDPLSKWSHSWEKGDGWIWEVAQQTL